MNKSISEILPTRLAQLRKDQGYTQFQVSEFLGINQKTYSVYETGRAQPSIDTLFKLCELYHFDNINQLLFGDNTGQTQPKDDLQIRYRKLPQEKRKIVDFILQL